MWHRFVSPVTVALVIGAVAGCTGGRHEAVGPDPAPGSTEPATEYAVELDGPIERTDVPTLLAVGPRTGSYTTTADITGERFELLVHCVGGEVTVEIVGIATTPYQCTADGLGRPETYGAEFNLHEAPGEVTVAVTAGAATQWRLHLGLLPAP